MRLQVASLRVPLVGAVCLAATTYGVVRVHLDGDLPAFRRDLLSRWPEAELKGDGPVTRAAGKAIREYLAGGASPEVEVVLPEDGFSARVWREIAKIPRGEVRSYARVAKALRKPGAARAVGQACGRNPVPILVPCHRVVAADGGLGGFTGNLDHKRLLLALEGVSAYGAVA